MRLGARRSRSRRRRRVPSVVGFALVAAIGLVAADEPGADADCRRLANATSDLLQPSLEGNPATPPRFRRPGEARAAEESVAAAQQIHGADPHWRDADLWQPQRFRRRQHRLRFARTPRTAAKKKKPVQTPALALVVPPQPETTFTPVPTFNPAAPSQGRRRRRIRRRRRSIRRRRRCGSARPCRRRRTNCR